MRVNVGQVLVLNYPPAQRPQARVLVEQAHGVRHPGGLLRRRVVVLDHVHELGGGEQRQAVVPRDQGLAGMYY
jgi:hypothetical protein